MTFADLPLEHRVLEHLRRGQRAEGVRHVRPTLPHSLGQLFLREVVRLHQELVRASGLDGVEVGPLEVLHERELETIVHVVTDDRRDRSLAGRARREHAPVTCDELEAVALPRYHDWLQNAVTGDRSGELVDALVVELSPRLLRVRSDPLKGDLRRGGCHRRYRSWLRPEKDVQTPAEATARHQ